MADNKWEPSVNTQNWRRKKISATRGKRREKEKKSMTNTEKKKNACEEKGKQDEKNENRKYLWGKESIGWKWETICEVN